MLPDHSILLSVYRKENPDYLHQALHSLFAQSLLANQVVLVKDGPLTEALEDEIRYWTAKYPGLFRIVTLTKNMGLGIALSKGLEVCSNELVARVDSDDINMPERMEMQVVYLSENKDIDVVGSQINEFEGNPEIVRSVRRVPVSFEDIKKKARFRNPMNHMTVMFKKSSLLSVGGYIDFPGFEDYYLWARLLLNGFKLANLDKTLVKARTGEEMIRRRRGLKYMRQECYLQCKFLEIGFINVPILTFNILTRTSIRMLPERMLTLFYKSVLRQ